jgi:hypothetical protein
MTVCAAAFEVCCLNTLMLQDWMKCTENSKCLSKGGGICTVCY